MRTALIAWRRLRCALPACAALLGLASGALQAQGIDTLQRLQESNRFVIAYRGGMLPMSDHGAAPGRASGYAVDLCMKIVQALQKEWRMPGLKVEFLPVDGTTRFSALASGKADIECGSTANNAERRRSFAFAIPHFFSSVRMLVPAGSGVRDWPDLQKKRIAVLARGSIEHAIRERDKVRALQMEIVTVNDLSEAIRMLEEGKVDAVAGSDVFLYEKNIGMREPSAYVITGKPLAVEQYGLMMRKDDQALLRLANRELARLADSGEFVRIYNRWLMLDAGNGRQPRYLPMSPLLRRTVSYPSSITVN